jgi:hypothetical protein
VAAEALKSLGEFQDVSSGALEATNAHCEMMGIQLLGVDQVLAIRDEFGVRGHGLNGAVATIRAFPSPRPFRCPIRVRFSEVLYDLGRLIAPRDPILKDVYDTLESRLDTTRKVLVDDVFPKWGTDRRLDGTNHSTLVEQAVGVRLRQPEFGFRVLPPRGVSQDLPGSALVCFKKETPELLAGTSNAIGEISSFRFAEG